MLWKDTIAKICKAWQLMMKVIDGELRVLQSLTVFPVSPEDSVKNTLANLELEVK